MANETKTNKSGDKDNVKAQSGETPSNAKTATATAAPAAPITIATAAPAAAAAPIAAATPAAQTVPAKPAAPAKTADAPAADAQTKKPEKKTPNDILDEGEAADAGDLILDEERVSIPLTPKNTRFYRSGGNLISLELTKDDGTKEFFERVVILRAFPITNPNEFLSVREPGSRRLGRGKEIGMIRYMSDFDEQTEKLFLEELDRRYFSPQLKKITSVKEKFGYLYWEAETSAGHVTFILNNPFSNIRLLEDNRILITDMDGNCFEIPEPDKLDAASFKKIEVYL